MNCDYCNAPINSDEENHAGALDNACCKRCDDAAMVACDATESDIY
tara:strand:+ start:1245 stop:1382 length:138 start_codon:yes stop_codon:yes gene_type:complete